MVLLYLHEMCGTVSVRVLASVYRHNAKLSFVVDVVNTTLSVLDGFKTIVL